jgi:ABC-2 type transport system permease protein
VTEAAATVALPRADAPPTPVARTYRFELVKLLTQWPIRLALIACCLGPALFVVVVNQQSSLPSDTVFGRWMGQTGWAGPLVILSFSCSWVLPLLTSLVAGDVFASEDRLGTWRHLLVAVRSPRRIVAAKTLASLTVILLLAAGLAGSGIVGGPAAVGNRPLVGLDGHLLSSGQAAVAVLLAWVCVLAPTLAFAAVGLLGSATLGRSPLGLIVPARLALMLQIAQLLPLPVAIRVALPSYAFIGWRGLFTDPAQTGPLLAGIAVDVAWAVVAGALAYRLFMRRDFTDPAYDGMGSPALAQGVLPLRALLAVSVCGDRRHDIGLRLRDRQVQVGPLPRNGVRPSLRHADGRAASPRRHGGATAQRRLLRQGRLARRRCRAGQRLALCRDVAPPGFHGDRLGDLSARRHAGRALRRRRRRPTGGQRLLPAPHPDGRRAESGSSTPR